MARDTSAMKNRQKSPPKRQSGGGWFHSFVLIVMVPLALVAVIASGWYVYTGQTPLDLIVGMDKTPRAQMPMPQPIRITSKQDAGSGLLSPPFPADAAQPTTPQIPTTSPSENPPTSDDNSGAADGAAENAQDRLPSSELIAALPPLPAFEIPKAPTGGTSELPAFVRMPPRTDLRPLANAPEAGLLRETSFGAIPIIANGREPRIAYARPFTEASAKPRIGIVVVGLGLSREATDAAITKLPPDISLSFSPYATDLRDWIRKARAAGHEVLLDLPLQPQNYPTRDTGPLAIMANDTGDVLTQKMQRLMGKADSYIGFASTLHSPVATTEQWPSLLKIIRSHGLMFVGDGLAGVRKADAPAHAHVSIVLDETPFRAAIDARLARAELTAQRDGQVVAFISARPVSFERLLLWIKDIGPKGLQLAPISALTIPPA